AAHGRSDSPRRARSRNSIFGEDVAAQCDLSPWSLVIGHWSSVIGTSAMLLRHKVPTIFNIYMLDVICCALGCVILLWQVAHQNAEQQSLQAKAKGEEVAQAKERYEKSKQDL